MCLNLKEYRIKLTAGFSNSFIFGRILENQKLSNIKRSDKMVRCTICGKKKGWMEGGWRECRNCRAWYCSRCRDNLKEHGLVFKKKVCVRCGREM